MKLNLIFIGLMLSACSTFGQRPERSSENTPKLAEELKARS